MLSLNQIETILEQLKSCRFKINIHGGDLFSHPDFEAIVSLLDTYSAKKTYSIYYKNVYEYLDKIPDLHNNEIKILFDFPEETDLFQKVLTYSQQENIIYEFIVCSVHDYDCLTNIMNSCRLPAEKIKVRPFYNGNNNAFFEDNISLEKENFLDSKLNRRQLFANQIINTNYFGKLAIAADGCVYSDLSDQAIGRIENDFRVIIYNEIKKGNSWLRIRNQKPCYDCVYQWLCPSPSSYEIAVGKPNLCHVKP